MKYPILLVFAFFFSSVNSQITQVIRGKITDKESKTTLPGANIIIPETTPILGTTSDADGNFKMVVPVGRVNIKITFVGYDDVYISQLLIASGKETFLNIEMQESVSKVEEVVVKAKVDKTQALNSMASISARMISTEDASRYAAGYYDPARMVSSFAGVAAVEGDGKNDIVIRGNSPRGLQWKLEGIEIPSPNHFSDGEGDAGGAFCAITSNVMANSDFYTGAFPAEYGNALSGILDINLRKGNASKREYGFQVGITGLEASLEGPIGNSNSSSYLVNYRYANFQALNKAGLIDLGENRRAPQFQDLTFNVNIPTSKAGTFQLFGVGGYSTTGKFGIKDSLRWKTNGDLATDEIENHSIAIAGLKHSISLSNKKTFIKSIVAFTNQYNSWDMGYLTKGYTRFRSYYDEFNYPTYIINSSINHKMNSNHTIRIGFSQNILGYSLYAEQFNYDKYQMEKLADRKASTSLTETYMQWKYRINEKFEFNSGLHYLLFQLNKHYSVEPRFGIKWQVTNKSSVNYGFGIHSRIEPISAYFAKVNVNGTIGEFNKDVNFTRAIHNVLGYDLNISNNLRLKIELYNQYLYDVPIIDDTLSTVSAINAQYGLPDVKFTNKGKGYNSGIEITLEKFYSSNYYFLYTLSVYDSKYRAGNGKLYNTYFNGNYVTNFLIGKDFNLGNNTRRILGFNVKALVRGGFRYTPVDFSKSGDDPYYIESESFEKQYPYFLRFDIGVKYRKNNEGYSWIVTLDIQNVTNRKNILGYEYVNDQYGKRLIPSEGMGLVPVISYRIEF